MELLIVIAIIAILAGILFPVFLKVRESARKTSCLSNMSQIGKAVLMYVEAYDETLPTTGSDQVGGDVVGILEPYTKQAFGQGIWRCPSHDLSTESSWTSSYGYNWEYLLEAGPDYPHTDYNGFYNSGLTYSDITRPTETICFMEDTAPESNTKLWSFIVRPGDPSNNNGMGRPDFRHNGKANVLFCDGHVKTVSRSYEALSEESTYWDPR